MKLLLAALAVTFAIAVTASVFAIWPVVADAPWLDDAPAVEDRSGDSDRTDTTRCEGALSLRASVVAAGEYSSPSVPQGLIPRVPSIDDVRSIPGNPGGLRNYDAQLATAEREIDRYC